MVGFHLVGLTITYLFKLSLNLTDTLTFVDPAEYLLSNGPVLLFVIGSGTTDPQQYGTSGLDGISLLL